MSDPDQHVCEVQLVHEGMLTARKHCNAHAAYAKFRSALELLETFGLMTLPPLTDEEEIHVSAEAKAASEKLAQNYRFVQEFKCEYISFLEEYQQKLGIPPVVDTDGHTEKGFGGIAMEDDSASYPTSMAFAPDLQVEEITSQHHEITTLHQQNTSQQREITALHHKIERIRMQLEQFMKTA